MRSATLVQLPRRGTFAQRTSVIDAVSFATRVHVRPSCGIAYVNTIENSGVQ